MFVLHQSFSDHPTIKEPMLSKIRILVREIIISIDIFFYYKYELAQKSNNESNDKSRSLL